MRPVKNFLSELARRWTHRPPDPVEFSQGVGQRKPLRAPRPRQQPAPYRPKPRSDIVSHL